MLFNNLDLVTMLYVIDISIQLTESNIYYKKKLTISVVKSPTTASSLIYQRYVTSDGLASERHAKRTSAPSGIRPPAIVPPITATDTFGAYFTYVKRSRN